MEIYFNSIELLRTLSKVKNREGIYCLNLDKGFYIIVKVSTKRKNEYIEVKLKHIETGNIICIMRFCINGVEENSLNIKNIKPVLQFIEMMEKFFIINSDMITDITREVDIDGE